MSKTCGVDGCITNNRSRKTYGLPPLRFYRIPAVKGTVKNEKLKVRAQRRRSLWLERLFGDTSAQPYVDFRVCGDHFLAGEPAPDSAEDHLDWAPSQKLKHFVSDAPELSLTDLMNNKTAEILEDKNVDEPEGTNVDVEEDRNVAETVVNQPDDMEEVGIDCDSDDSEDVFYDACSWTGGDVATQTNKCCMADSWTQVKRVTRSIGVQTDMTKDTIDMTERHLTSQLTDALSKLNLLELGEETYKDDEVTRYYTALPNYGALMVIYKLVAPYLPYSPRNSLTKFQQLALTLMKLRLNLYFRDLAFRFCVSRHTAYRTFHRCLEVMHTRLQKSIFWPDRETIKLTMPQCFREAFGDKVTVIIDCFEIFIEKAANQTAQAQTWSNYKHHQTIKFLIGITPQGFVCFISKAWGGRSTDKMITEHSTFLSHLNPGDLVMSDRGFLIEESVRFHLAKVVMPAFTKGLEQLSPKDVESTRSIANVRIHVERVIGQLRQKYRILSNRLPITLLNCEEKNERVSISQIAFVCCGLVNMCDAIVPLD